MVLREAVEALVRCFKRAANMRAAHAEGRIILEQLSRVPSFTSEVLEKYLDRTQSLTRGNYPVLAMPIEANPYFELVLNCWVPLPTGETDVSTKAIHHHGIMLLSTATIFGPGYEHWLFTRARHNGANASLYRMEALEVTRLSLHKAAFVDAYVPHLPVYPADLSLTLALWSDSRGPRWLNHLKSWSGKWARKEALRALALRFRLGDALDLKLVENFDFRPSEHGFEVISDRREFPLGPNADHLHSLFHVLQRTGNEHLASTVARRLESGENLPNRNVLRELLGRLRSGEAIEGRLSEGHFDVPFANFKTARIRRALIAQQSASHGS